MTFRAIAAFAPLLALVGTACTGPAHVGPGSAAVAASAASAASAAGSVAGRSVGVKRPRVIVTTDGEVDDRSSFVRFLHYTTDFDVAGIIATNSIWQKDGHGTGWILDLIKRYEEVRPNLLQHHPRFPDPDSLRALVVLGKRGPGLPALRRRGA